MAESPESSAQLYSYVATKLVLTPPFELHSPLPPGVLAYVTELEDSILCIFESEVPVDTAVPLRDAITGADLKANVPALHVSLALLDKKAKAIIAKYGF